MKLRIREHVDGSWQLERKEWWQLEWRHVHLFHVISNDNAYNRAKEYAMKIKDLRIEVIK